MMTNDSPSWGAGWGQFSAQVGHQNSPVRYALRNYANVIVASGLTKEEAEAAIAKNPNLSMEAENSRTGNPGIEWPSQP